MIMKEPITSIEPVKSDLALGPQPRRWPFAALIVAVWTLMSLLRATQVSLGFEMMGHVPGWWRLAIWQLLVFYLWMVLTPVILWLGRRFKLERSYWVLSFLAHLLLGSLVSLFYLSFAKTHSPSVSITCETGCNVVERRYMRPRRGNLEQDEILAKDRI